MAPARIRDDQRRISGYAAYYEPLLPAPVLARQARRLRYEAFLAERSDPRAAEALFRQAIERFVDAFLVDRAGHAQCFTEAHVIGRHVAETFECPMTSSEDGYWTVPCGVLALHQRLGLSFAGPTLGRCSGAEPTTSTATIFRAPGTTASTATAGSHGRAREISLVQFPEDPRCYRVQTARTPRELREARGRPLRRGEVPICTHCVECEAVERGPRVDDVDQSLWPPVLEHDETAGD